MNLALHGLLLQDMGFKTIFTKENEELLCDIILKHEAKLHGFTSIEVRRLAYNLAKELKLQHYFKGEQCLAGKEWFRGCMRRHPQLSLRKPEPTSAARATGFNKTSVTEFFNILDKLYKEYNFQAENIYNVDETGISCNPKSQSKVIALRGKRQVGCKVSRERGETVTACLCFSACGRYMPPLLIFPRKRVNTSYLEGASPGAWAEFNQSGWMDESIFIKWLKKFIIYSHASKDMPILLVLDGHSTHVKNLEAIKLAEQNGVIIVCFPPHCTHKLQPLDLAFMKPLSNHYSGAINQWLREHPYSIVNLKDIFSIFTTAFIKASTMETAINGFRKTGVFPFNPNVFSENDFITTRPLETIESNIHATEIDSSINIVQSIKCDENSEISEGPIRLQFENNLVILSILNFKHGFRLCSAGEPGYLDFDNLPETNFSCQGKVIGGYYADVEAGCQMFHVCTIGQKDEIMDIKFLCLNGTVFDQETRVCERVDEVDCSKSERFYNLNLELYGNNAVTLSLHEEEDEEESTELREENHHQQQHITSARPSTTSTTTTTTSRPSQPSTTSANNIYQQHPTGYPQHYQPRPAFPSVQTSQSNTHYDDKNGGYHHQYIFHNDERNNNNQATSYQLFSNQGVSSTTPTPQVHQQIRYSSTVSPQVIHNEPSTGAPIQFHVQSTSSSIQTLLNSNANNPSLINPLYHNHGIASTTEQFNRNNPREIVEYQDNSEDDENEQNERRPLEAIQSTNKGKVSKLTISPVPQQDNRPMIIQTKSSQSLQQPRISVNYLPTPAPIQTTINAFYPTQRSNSQNAQKSLNNQHVTQHIHVPPPQPIPQLKPHHVTITIPPSDIQRIVQNPSPLLPSQSRVIVTAKASVSDESGRPLNTSQLITLPLPKIPSNYDDYKEGDESFDPFYRDVPKIRNDHRIVVNRKIETNERNMRRKRSVNNEEIHGSSPSEQVIFNAEIKDIMDLKANLPIIKAILFDLPLPENIKTASDRSTKNNENESVNNTNMKNETIADNLQNIKPWLAFVPNQNTTLKSNQYSMKKIDEQEFSNVQLPTTMKSEEKQYILSNINIKPVNTEDRFDQLLSTNLQQKEGFDALNAKHDHIKTGPKDSIHLFLSSIRDNTSINERTITVQNDLLIPLNNIQNKTDKVKQEILQTRPSSNRNKSNRRKFQNHGPIEESEEYSSSRDSRINNPKLSRYYAEYDASESIESSSRQRPNRLRQRLRGGRIVNYRDEYIDDENIEDDRYGEDNVSTARKRTLRRGSQGRRVHYRNSNRDYDYKDDAEVDEKPKARTKNINISDRFKPQTHSENLSNYTEQKVELTERRGNNRGPLSDPLHNGRSSNKTYTIDGRINEKIDTKLSEDINPHEIAEKRKKLLKYSLISEHDRATERKWLNSAVKGKESNEPNEQSQEDYLESSELYADDYNESMEDVPDDYVDYRDLREPVRRSRLNNFKNNNKFIEEFELIPERKTHRRNKSRKFVNDVPLNQDNVEEADEDGNIESTTYKDDKDTKMTNIPEDYTTSDEANTSVESHDYKSSNSSQVEVTELPKTTVGITSTEGVIKFTDELPRTDKKDEVQDYIINKDKVVTNEQEYVDDNYEPESYIDFKYKESLSGLSLTKENLKEKIFIVSGEQKDIHIANNKSSSNDSSAHIEKHQEYDDIYEDRLKSITALYSSDEYEDLETTTDIISRSATLPPVITAAPVSSPSSRIKTITKTSTTTIPTTIITTTTTTSTTITTTTSTPSTTYSTASASTTPSQSRTKATSKFFKPITFRKNYAYIPPSTTPAAVLIRRGKPLSGPKPTKPPPSYNELAPKPIIRRLPLLSRTTTTTSEATLIEDKIDSDLSKYDSEETSTSPNDNLTASTIMKQHSPLNEITTTLVTTIKMKSNKDITEVLDSTTVNMNDHTQPQEAYTSTPLQYNQTIHSTNKNHDNEVSKQILDSKESNNVPQTSKDSVAETAKPNLATSVNDGLSTLQISTKWETSNPKILDIQTITTTTTTIKTPRPSERRKIESISGKSEIQKSIQSPKRVAGFNCLEKEMYRFYGDSRDCRLFHYCSPGFTVRQVLDFRFVCEEGTIFDEESQSCRHDVPTPKCVKRTW